MEPDPDASQTLGTTETQWILWLQSQSRQTVRTAQVSSGQRMLEKAKAPGNAGDRGSNFAPR